VTFHDTEKTATIHHRSLLYRRLVRYSVALARFSRGTNRIVGGGDKTGDSPKDRARNARRETQPSYSGKSQEAVELPFFDRNCGRAKEKAPRQRRSALTAPPPQATAPVESRATRRAAGQTGLLVGARKAGEFREEQSHQAKSQSPLAGIARRKGTAQEAANRVAQALVEENKRIIDIDLSAYFDNVQRSPPLEEVMGLCFLLTMMVKTKGKTST
jgi:hypothetical protein